ncbi:MAG: PQQ-dependent sugar dehydrogenase [Nitrosopumilus sp.]|nr:PQQ-dependent sugar dehydrogenase [Nitrosopumilus sp.]
MRISNKHLLSVFIVITLISAIYYNSAFGNPELKDNNLKVELLVKGLSSPTSMSFIDSNNILVLEKNNREVRLIYNNQLQEKPVLKLNVDNTTLTCCRGLLGIATKIQENSIGVFLYLSEISKDNNQPEVRNKVYKFNWDGENLVNPKVLLDLPAEPGPNHPSGKIVIGKDGYLYTAIGDLNNEGQLQNIKDGPQPSDSSVFLRINTIDGSAASNNPFVKLAKSYPDSQMAKYYGYGLRNSFGLAIDPVTGFLWDTENGDTDYDEINIVQPGFNSGWKKIMGPISESDLELPDLVTFPGSHYMDPAFSWNPSLGVTDIEFLGSSKLGINYENNVFIGDITKGNLYYFKLNHTRTGILFDDPNIQDDLIANDKELNDIILGTGFEGITDIVTGPEGYLYILTFDQEQDGDEKIYRVLPITRSI